MEPSAVSASTRRSLVTISSGVCLFMVLRVGAQHYRSDWIRLRGAGHLVYDQDEMRYRSRERVLLATREMHVSYAQAVLHLTF